MTLDQQIQVWNAVGTWLAGITTFMAVVVDLATDTLADILHGWDYRRLHILSTKSGDNHVD
jgi:hypothetical protein